MQQITKFSPIVAGTMLWGQWGKKYSTAAMSALISHCVAHDITSFDHADIYGGYTNEEDFGLALQTSSIRRSDIQLISKCGIKMVCDNRSYRLGHYDYTLEYIMSSCDRSLSNLKTDYLDLFLMHRPSPLMQGEIIAEAATKLKAQGKILDFGLSNFTPSQTAIIRQYVPVSFNQIEFSLTHHLPLTDGSLDDMVLHRIRPMAWGPLGKIFKESTAYTASIKAVLDVLSQKYNVPADIILYNWILRHPAGIIPVVGTGDKDRIATLKTAWSFLMEEEDWFELWVAGMGHPVP